ncbi:MAG: hypothetical protein L6R42_006025 [Xanthoria sp. 1 TBL-2021]|nr:MAG: hypothetical protein L6R42_006025 [Xanthoria sp. 1 TBL-2021]
MVVTVGLYKAVRLRHVCSKFPSVSSANFLLMIVVEAFDAEVRRAIFATNHFDFNQHFLFRNMTPEYIRLWLMAKIARPAPNDRDAVSSAVTKVTKLLLADIPTLGYEERRLAYVGSLCDAVAHNFDHRFSDLLDTMSQTHDTSSAAVDDLLSAAAAVGDLHKVQRLLLDEPGFYSRSRIFGYASAHAARKGDKEMLTSIIKTSTEPNCRLGLKHSTGMALVAACRAGQQDIVEYLLSLSSQIHFLDRDFDNSFETAAAHGQTHILRLLLPRLSTTNRNVVLSRSLRQASASGHTPAVQYLLNSGSDLMSWEPSGGALHLAARSGFSQVVRVLLNRGAGPNERSQYGQPLFFAAKNGHTEVVQILLDHGADINAKGHRHSVLARAARNGELTMVKYLLNKGVDLMAPGNGGRALEEAADWGHEDVVKLLVGLGVNINGLGGKRDPPILRAMVCGQQHIVKLLVELGAKEQDPSETRYAAKFADGRLPIREIAMSCSQWGIPQPKSLTPMV